MAHQFFDSKVLEIIDETGEVKRFIIEFNKDIPFSFRAGQFVMLNFPINAKISHRSYSIASPPADNHQFELVIVLNPKGLGTPWMWENLKPGSPIPVSKPLGKFGLPEVLDRDLCFICTGVGIAPFRSMILSVKTKSTGTFTWFSVQGIRQIFYTAGKWKKLLRNIRSLNTCLLIPVKQAKAGKDTKAMFTRYMKSFSRIDARGIFIFAGGTTC
jgi:ferredoxin-NADP reductase